jgi:citrate synthase
VAPDAKLGHAANFLWMLKGEKPSTDAAKLLDVDLVLHAEHGSNASSFTARVVVGTQANLHAAITAAVAALSGPAHGGAAEDVLGMAQEIGDPANVAAYVKKKRDAKEAITGFGHRVYRAEDPRARHMREGVKRLSQEMGQPQWYAILEALVQAMAPYARHGVNVNVDFYSGVIYYLHQIPKDLFVPLRRRPRARLDRAGAGAAGQQHPDPAAHALQRAGAARLRSDRQALTRKAQTKVRASRPDLIGLTSQS